MDKLYKVDHFGEDGYIMMTKYQLLDQHVSTYTYHEGVNYHVNNTKGLIFNTPDRSIPWQISCYTTNFKNKEEVIRYIEHVDNSDDFDFKMEKILND